MGLKNFFRNAWNGAKNGATKVFNGLRKGAEFVGRVAKPIGTLASTAGSILGVLPGKVGEFGKLISHGGDAIKSITNLLPNSEVKEKLNNAIDKGLDYSHRAIDKGQTFINDVNNKAQPWLTAAPQIANCLSRYATDFANY